MNNRNQQVRFVPACAMQDDRPRVTPLVKFRPANRDVLVCEEPCPAHVDLECFAGCKERRRGQDLKANGDDLVWA